MLVDVSVERNTLAIQHRVAEKKTDISRIHRRDDRLEFLMCFPHSGSIYDEKIDMKILAGCISLLLSVSSDSFLLASGSIRTTEMETLIMVVDKNSG